MSDRFFVTRIDDTKIIELIGDEAQHLNQVMRGRVGTRVQLFDGQGHEATAVIQVLSKKTVKLQIESVSIISREAGCRVILGTALPKSGRERFLVEKTVELGVAEFVALESTHSVVKPSSGFIDKANRIAIEASKQCGRNQLMQIRLASFCDYVTAADLPATRLIADPSGVSIGEIDTAAHDSIALAIGPEGGFTEQELDEATDAGWQRVALGERILRIETAALALASQFLLD